MTESDMISTGKIKKMSCSVHEEISAIEEEYRKKIEAIEEEYQQKINQLIQEGKAKIDALINEYETRRQKQ